MQLKVDRVRQVLRDLRFQLLQIFVNLVLAVEAVIVAAHQLLDHDLIEHIETQVSVDQTLRNQEVHLNVDSD